jgi:hypothetical protein
VNDNTLAELPVEIGNLNRLQLLNVAGMSLPLFL